MSLPEFTPFAKMARLSRPCVITEKIDGTNASVYVSEDLSLVAAGSRNRWLTREQDNYGFAKWVEENVEELRKLGPGQHFGEWWGPGINRNYGAPKRTFSLFNTSRWNGLTKPACCDVVPVLYSGVFAEEIALDVLRLLGEKGSIAQPGFMKPEGICIYHEAAGLYFKKTLEGDEMPKNKREAA